MISFAYSTCLSLTGAHFSFLLSLFICLVRQRSNCTRYCASGRFSQRPRTRTTTEKKNFFQFLVAGILPRLFGFVRLPLRLVGQNCVLARAIVWRESDAFLASLAGNSTGLAWHHGRHEQREWFCVDIGLVFVVDDAALEIDRSLVSTRLVVVAYLERADGVARGRRTTDGGRHRRATHIDCRRAKSALLATAISAATAPARSTAATTTVTAAKCLLVVSSGCGGVVVEQSRTNDDHHDATDFANIVAATAAGVSKNV